MSDGYDQNMDHDHVGLFYIQLFFLTNNTYILPNTVSDNREWVRYPARLRIGHRHYMSREQPPTCEDWKIRSINNKTHPNGMPFS